MKARDSRSHSSSMPAILVIAAALALIAGGVTTWLSWQGSAKGQGLLGFTPVRVVDEAGRPVEGALVRILGKPDFRPGQVGPVALVNPKVLLPDRADTPPLRTGVDGRVDVPYTAGGVLVTIEAGEQHRFGSLELVPQAWQPRGGGVARLESDDVDFRGQPMFERPGEVLVAREVVVEPAHVPVAAGGVGMPDFWASFSGLFTDVDGQLVLENCVPSNGNAYDLAAAVGLWRLERSPEVDRDDLSTFAHAGEAPKEGDVVQFVLVDDLDKLGAAKLELVESGGQQDQGEALLEVLVAGTPRLQHAFRDGDILGGLPRGIEIRLTRRGDTVQSFTFTIPEAATAPWPVEVKLAPVPGSETAESEP